MDWGVCLRSVIVQGFEDLLMVHKYSLSSPVEWKSLCPVPPVSMMCTPPSFENIHLQYLVVTRNSALQRHNSWMFTQLAIACWCFQQGIHNKFEISALILLFTLLVKSRWCFPYPLAVPGLFPFPQPAQFGWLLLPLVLRAAFILSLKACFAISTDRVTVSVVQEKRLPCERNLVSLPHRGWPSIVVLLFKVCFKTMDQIAFHSFTAQFAF